MARRRFTKEQKAAFTVGARIQWRNGSHWHPGEIMGLLATDSIGKPYYPIRHVGPTTRTVSHGACFWGYPDSIRLPV
jgi:hypothetical protein